MVVSPITDLDILELVIERLDVGVVCEYWVQCFVRYACEKVFSVCIHVASTVDKRFHAKASFRVNGAVGLE